MVALIHKRVNISGQSVINEKTEVNVTFGAGPSWAR